MKNSVSWARSALLHGIYCIFYWVKFAITRKNDAFVAKIVNTRLTKNSPPRKAAKFCHPVSRSIYFLLVITTEDDLCHGPQFDVIWAIVINLMSYMRSTHQNGSKANSLHLSLHKFEICPFRNNEISQELRKRSYYPFKVDYVYHWMNLFVVQVQKCGRPPIIESNILTKKQLFWGQRSQGITLS